MFEGVFGKVNTEVVLTFDISVENKNSIKKGEKLPILKDSKSFEKGACMSFSESELTLFHVKFSDIITSVLMVVNVDKTMPKMRISTKLPKAESYNVSEFYVEGHFDISQINIESDKKSIDGKTLQDKLQKTGKVVIKDKLLIEIKGPPQVKTDLIESEFGPIRKRRSKLNIDV